MTDHDTPTKGAHHEDIPPAPQSAGELRKTIRTLFNIDPADTPIVPGHRTPMDYLAHAYFQGELPDNPDKQPPRDCVVWANRGGGKTFYAAIATTLDLLYKPGVEIKLVAGSREQALRMFAHLTSFFASPVLAPLVEGRISASRLTLENGSSAEILSQSHASVRGARPQIVRCDEVELFDPDVWEAIQLAPRSRQCGPVFVRGAIEALSTWHLPSGLMSKLVAQATDDEPTNAPTRSLFRWGVLDVLERCPIERPCEPCELEPECAGRAKDASGHVFIDDAITIKKRTGRESWEAEMLTLRPSRRDAVYPEFDPDRHVREPDDATRLDESSLTIGGMDFGFRSPTVVLWARLTSRGIVHVTHEHVRSELTLEKHIEIVRSEHFPRLDWIGVDPAGQQRNDQTGLSDVSQLRSAGLKVRALKAPVELGLRAIRQRLDPALGEPTLFISPNCPALIRSLLNYRYPSDDPHARLPAKDGADHAADALRYMMINIGITRTATLTHYT